MTLTDHSLATPEGSPRPYELSPPEMAVLAEMAKGVSDAQIAATLGIAKFTVEEHKAAILHKMAARSRTEAAVRAIRERIVP